MSGTITTSGFHQALLDKAILEIELPELNEKTRITYTFYNHFHPFVSELLQHLNKKLIDGLLDVNFHTGLVDHFFKDMYDPTEAIRTDDRVNVNYFPKEIDVSENGPYSVYNWELFFHAPLAIAVHLSKNQRFAEAQRWFHYIFDPTSTDKEVSSPQKFWKFLAFRKQQDVKQIDELLRILSKPINECTPDEIELKGQIQSGYEAILNNPFQPHAVARTRFLAYQYCTVMKYLDNLITWGDSLFRQDTLETINEATQLYVLAANILGPKPQQIPQRGKVKPKTFAQLRERLDPMSNALVELEGKFPFNLYSPSVENVDTGKASPLFGIGRTLYFCIPRNDKLLSYWDTVADRLFKIRHCMNIEGIVQQRSLFGSPIDPGMLVKAAAAGIDVSSLVSGLNQPLSPVRSPLILQKALELCNEVRSLGNSLLSALEKKDGEALSLLRQKHEMTIQQMMQNVRFLQWKEAEASTESLLQSRSSALERYRHHQRLLGKEEPSDLSDFALERPDLTEGNFDEVFGEMVNQYVHEQELKLEEYPPLENVDENNAFRQSGNGHSPMYLTKPESQDLNEDMPESQDKRDQADKRDLIASIISLIPDFGISVMPFGLGGTLSFGGSVIGQALRIKSGRTRGEADKLAFRGSQELKTANYKRRPDDWILNSNLAALELPQIGRQIITSLIREQILRHEYKIHQEQIKLTQEVDDFLRQKFTNEELYGWMQGELSKLYYEYYKFAFDVARKAEQTMKQELMRPELDEMNFIKFNYWDGGRKGLLSGEALYLDLKRMEMAYHDYNKREYELTKHISLQQLDPLALLSLKATGTCEITIPEWFLDLLDCPGHYMRRIKSVGVSMPSVIGPYTSINCTLSLLKSSLRRSPLLAEGEYARQGSEDSRFVDYYGTIQSIVTSSANNDSGMFETNLRDERFLPFENAGAESTWKLELPSEFRQFDYNTISDVIIHMRFTSRQGGTQLKEKAVEHIQSLVEDASSSGLIRLFSLKHDFPAEWHQFVSSDENFQATVKKDYFPYFVQDRNISINQVELYAIRDREVVPARSNGVNPAELTTALNDNEQFEVSLPPDEAVLTRNREAQVFLVFRYSLI